MIDAVPRSRWVGVPPAPPVLPANGYAQIVGVVGELAALMLWTRPDRRVVAQPSSPQADAPTVIWNVLKEMSP